MIDNSYIFNLFKARHFQRDSFRSCYDRAGYKAMVFVYDTKKSLRRIAKTDNEIRRGLPKGKGYRNRLV